MSDLLDWRAPNPRPKKQTVTDYVLEQLLAGRRITRLDIFNEIWSMTLNSRIPEIKDKGVDVKDKFIERTNSRGESKSFKQYWLTKEEIERIKSKDN
jgi:hypothetical protein